MTVRVHDPYWLRREGHLAVDFHVDHMALAIEVVGFQYCSDSWELSMSL